MEVKSQFWTLVAHVSIFVDQESGRAGEIRTHDLLHPMQAFYQAELRPDLFAGLLTARLGKTILAFACWLCN